MPILAIEAWEAARLEAEALVAPYPHLDVVPHVFTALSGLLWSASYLLMTIQAFKDKSYGMPIYCLCLNITWEGIYGFVYGSGPLNQFVFAQWMIVDLFLFYATVKFGAYEWRHQPLVAKNLAWIIIAGTIVCLWMHVAMAATLIPVIGRRIVFFTAWTLQIIINAGSIAQILCRGNTRGHSWGIWLGIPQTTRDIRLFI
jgi:paspaline synthase